MGLAKRLRKIEAAARVPGGLRALRYGVGAAIEHASVLSGLDLKTIVDVGANKGQFTLFARSLYPQARIIAFEPLDAPAATFHKLFSEDPNITLHKLAIGPTRGVAKMHISHREDSSSLLPIGAGQAAFRPGTEEVGTTDVRVARLSDVVSADDIAPKALIKFDVQGFEGRAIDGCADLLDRFSYLICEVSFVPLYDGEDLAHDVIMKLAGHGFRVASMTDVRYGEHGGHVVPVQTDILFSR